MHPPTKSSKTNKTTDMTPRDSGTICRLFSKQISNRDCARATSPDERGPADDRAYEVHSEPPT
eukprot:12031379-Heterocapsa_arctica.AAC.1